MKTLYSLISYQTAFFLFNKNVLTFNVNETFSSGDNATKSYKKNNDKKNYMHVPKFKR